MPPDEITPHSKDELNLSQESSNNLISRMAEDLLAYKKSSLALNQVVIFLMQES